MHQEELIKELFKALERARNSLLAAHYRLAIIAPLSHETVSSEYSVTCADFDIAKLHRAWAEINGEPVTHNISSSNKQDML